MSDNPLLCGRTGCEALPTHEAHTLGGGGNGQVFLCPEHAADPEAKTWYLEPPGPILVQYHYASKEVFDVYAPGGLVLAREDDLDDTPFEWTRDHSRRLGFTRRERAEHAAKKAPKWWESQAWKEVKREHEAAQG